MQVLGNVTQDEHEIDIHDSCGTSGWMTTATSVVAPHSNKWVAWDARMTHVCFVRNVEAPSGDGEPWQPWQAKRENMRRFFSIERIRTCARANGNSAKRHQQPRWWSMPLTTSPRYLSRSRHTIRMRAVTYARHIHKLHSSSQIVVPCAVYVRDCKSIASEAFQLRATSIWCYANACECASR